MTQEGKLVILGDRRSCPPQRDGPEFTELSMPRSPTPEDSESVADRMDFAFGRNFDFRDRVRIAERGRCRASGDRRVDAAARAARRRPARGDAAARRVRAGGLREARTRWRRQGGPDRRDDVPLPRIAAGPPTTSPAAGTSATFRTQHARQGFIEEDGWLWSPTRRPARPVSPDGFAPAPVGQQTSHTLRELPLIESVDETGPPSAPARLDSANQATATVVAILGMHRSGTSWLAGSLETPRPRAR